jgi:plastocyanin
MKAIALVIVVLVSIGFSGCAAEGNEVEIDDNYFVVEGKPSSRNGNATAKVGDVFEFKSEGKIDHTVTIHVPPAASAVFAKDDTVKPGGETSFTFPQAGTYHVFCRFHGNFTSGMHLTVTVA